jgi:hypothetical protein
MPEIDGLPVLVEMLKPEPTPKVILMTTLSEKIPG